jgi:uncharacterized protein
MSLGLAEQVRLVRALSDERVFGHPVSQLRLLETHISFVILSGLYAYKIKKAVDLEFLNFVSLENRKKYCAEELRLNRRTAPGLYLDVLPIGGTVAAPLLGSEPAIEYALKMREFPQDDLAANALAQGRIKPAQWDCLADDLAAFHAAAKVAAAESAFGRTRQIRESVLQNFRQLDRHVTAQYALKARHILEDWTRATYLSLQPVMDARRRNGHVRECHGDLHLGNLVLLADRVTPFDCIEFNPQLRWIDVMSDIAFLTMDLDHREVKSISTRLLNRYLESSGDYAGLRVLKFYQMYRALVRAKVALIRARQENGEASALRLDVERLLALAMSYTRFENPALLITHGFSGSGKTAFSQGLMELIGAVRIRSDVERKRMHGMNALARSDASLAEGIYDTDSTEKTYDRLLQLAQLVMRCGYSPIIDAAFLERGQRQKFQRLAKEWQVPFFILDFQAPLEVLRARLLERERAGTDASDANTSVLDFQLRTRDPLTEDEAVVSVTIDTQRPLHDVGCVDLWQGLLQRIGVRTPD